MKRNSTGVTLVACGGALVLCGMMLFGMATQRKALGLSLIVGFSILAGLAALLIGMLLDAVRRD